MKLPPLFVFSRQGAQVLMSEAYDKYAAMTKDAAQHPDFLRSRYNMTSFCMAFTIASGSSMI